MGDRFAPGGPIFDDGMAVTEIVRSSPLGPRRRLGQAAYGIAQIVEIGRVCRCRVVAVEAVFSQQFPVGGETVFLSPANDFHTVLTLVDQDVDIVRGIGQIGLERDRLSVEIDEIEAAIAVQPRR